MSNFNLSLLRPRGQDVRTRLMGAFEPVLAAVSSERTFARRSDGGIIWLHLRFLQNVGFKICLIIEPAIGLELHEQQEWTEIEKHSGVPTFY